MVAGFAVGWISDKAGVRFALVLSYACVAGAAALPMLAPTGVLPMVGVSRSPSRSIRSSG